LIYKKIRISWLTERRMETLLLMPKDINSLEFSIIASYNCSICQCIVACGSYVIETIFYGLL